MHIVCHTLQLQWTTVTYFKKKKLFLNKAIYFIQAQNYHKAEIWRRINKSINLWNLRQHTSWQLFTVVPSHPSKYFIKSPLPLLILYASLLILTFNVWTFIFFSCHYYIQSLTAPPWALPVHNSFRGFSCFGSHWNLFSFSTASELFPCIM